MEEDRSLRKRVNTRARLVEAATSVFVEKGFAGAKIDDVVRAAGFTRGAFYSNYSSMEDLLVEAVYEHGSRTIEHFHEAMESAGAPTIDSFMEILEALRTDGRTMYILKSELKLYAMRNPQAFVRFEEYDAGMNCEIKQLVTNLLARLGREATVDIDRVADTLVTAFLDGVSYDFVRRTDSGGPVVLRSLIESILYGMSKPIDELEGADPRNVEKESRDSWNESGDSLNNEPQSFENEPEDSGNESRN